MFFFKRKLSRHHSSLDKRRKLYKKLGKLFFMTNIISIILFISVLLSKSLFSQGGLLLLLLTTYAMMFNFTLLRLVRPRLTFILTTLKNKSKIDFSAFLRIIKPIESSINYLIAFEVSFLISLCFIIYFNVASVNNWILPNGLAIVLIYLYSFFLYYFINWKILFCTIFISKKRKR